MIKETPRQSTERIRAVIAVAEAEITATLQSLETNTGLRVDSCAVTIERKHSTVSQPRQSITSAEINARI